jgi:hypothetical protein
MALTSTTTFDIIGQTATLTFFDPGQIDQIVFSGGQFHYGAHSGFTLSKTDIGLYITANNIFNTFLLTIITGFAVNALIPWPLCDFSTSETFTTVKHINYIQTSTGNSIYNINYTPSSITGLFASRASHSTSIQEWLMSVNMLNQYAVQVKLN